MFEIITKWRARRAYVRKERWDAAVADIQAALAADRAHEKRNLIAKMNIDADAIDSHIAAQMETEEYKALQGQEKYEADRERNEATKIAQSKRETAKQLEEDAKGGEDTAKHFRRQAQASRETAERLRGLHL